MPIPTFPEEPRVTRKPQPIRESEARVHEPEAFQRPTAAPRSSRAVQDRTRRDVARRRFGDGAWAARACSSPRASRSACRAGCATPAGLGDRQYAMLPRATGSRTPRTSQTGGRAQEIQRLIGRSLLRGDRPHGVRRAHDHGGLRRHRGRRRHAHRGDQRRAGRAARRLRDAVEPERAPARPLRDAVGAISVGVVKGVPCLDLDYVEDSSAEVDMNIVMTGSGRFVEVQGTGEGATFSDADMRDMLRVARSGIRRIVASQRKLLGGSVRAAAAKGVRRRPTSEIRPRHVQSRQGARASGAARAARRRDRPARRLARRGLAGRTAPRCSRTRASRRAALALTGLPCIADDTGPRSGRAGRRAGIHAARFAGPDATYADNVAKLLRRAGPRVPARTRAVPHVLRRVVPGRRRAVRGRRARGHHHRTPTWYPRVRLRPGVSCCQIAGRSPKIPASEKTRSRIAPALCVVCARC